MALRDQEYHDSIRIKNVSTYGDEEMNESNITNTRNYIRKKLNYVSHNNEMIKERISKWLSFDTHILNSYKITNKEEYLGLDDDVSVFEMDLKKLEKYGNEDREKIIWLMKQKDGFICPGATIFTCTGGILKVDQEKVIRSIKFMNSNSQWKIERDGNYNILPVEGMTCLLYDTSGMLPSLMFGIVPRLNDNNISEDDNLFGDEKRFVKMMRIMKYASLCMTDNNHWVSLVCKPSGKDTIFIVCDSLDHEDITAYPNYTSFMNNFLVKRTQSDHRNSYLHKLPITLCLYPLIRDYKCNDNYDIFTFGLLNATIENLIACESPFLTWSEVRDIIDRV